MCEYYDQKYDDYEISLVLIQTTSSEILVGKKLCFTINRRLLRLFQEIPD